MNRKCLLDGFSRHEYVCECYGLSLIIIKLQCLCVSPVIKWQPSQGVTQPFAQSKLEQAPACPQPCRWYSGIRLDNTLSSYQTTNQSFWCFDLILCRNYHDIIRNVLVIYNNEPFLFWHNLKQLKSLFNRQQSMPIHIPAHLRDGYIFIY